jgi:hypothetical protein
MYSENKPTEALEEIKQMMHRSSRFISLSGWSGIAAGICALVAAWVAYQKISQYTLENSTNYNDMQGTYIFKGGQLLLANQLLIVGLLTFIAAFFFAFLFTWFRSRKTGVLVWGFTARKVMINLAVPMVVGALLIWRITDLGVYGLVAPVCLIFYGLALINASKFTLSEVRYLGYLQLLLGVINLWAMSYGLYFWAAGFGVLHILYGIIMWNKYERNEKSVV